ncbi:MAG: PilZ domain-containing protein [Candidatus Hydrogenedentota bacterium]|nr:MAG: PilZ domain-containing protein [Candidatus Hydrogenedentota bacterium]
MTFSRVEISSFDDAPEEYRFFRLLNIFSLLKSRQIPILLTYSGETLPATVSRVNMDSIVLKAPSFQETQERRAEIQFEVLNRCFYSEVFIRQANEDGIVLQFPSKLKYIQRRRHVRVPMNQHPVFFTILYSPLYATHEQEVQLANKFPHFMYESQQDKPSLRVLFQMLIAEITQITHDYDLVMLYKKPNQDRNFYENLLLREQKAIYIRDTSLLDSYIEKPKATEWTNLAGYMERESKKKDEISVLAEIEEIKKQDLRNFLVSFAYLPIRLYGNIIGYVRIESNQFNKFIISHFQIETLLQALEIFSYGITKIHIYETYYNMRVPAAFIVNLSVSGMLMEIRNATLFQYLQNNRRLKITLELNEKIIELNGEIIRFQKRIQDDDIIYQLGVLFFKSHPGDEVILEEYIFSRRKALSA